MNKSTALNDFKIIILACLLVLFSCQSEKTTEIIPQDLISEKKMIDVLIDIHLTESALSLKNFNRDSSLTLYAYYKRDIYKKYQITEEQFKTSYDYYAKHSAIFDHIYEVVIDSIDVKEARGKLE